MAVKVNDFFCGAGGMGLGFKLAGFEITGAWDFDKHAVETYKANVGDHVLQADISEMIWSDVPKADVWTFGFPCQDLSNAGAMAGMKLKCMDCSDEVTVEVGSPVDTCKECGGKFKAASRSGLFFEVMRLLDETAEEAPERLPTMLLAENVQGLRKFLPVLESEYKKRGYQMNRTLYNSRWWGVPQSRDRFFVAGVREGIEQAFTFPEQQTDYTPPLKGILEAEVDPALYLTIEQAKVITGMVDGDRLALRVTQATKLGYIDAYEGDSINISHPTSKTRRGRVGRQVAQTLLTGQEQLVVERLERSDDVPLILIRKYSTREAARLQGFPDDFKQVVSDAQFYKQMGNAVTVNVATAIAEQIKLFLESIKQPVG